MTHDSRREPLARPATPAAADNLRIAPLQFAALVGTMAMMAYVVIVGPVMRDVGLPEWAAGLAITIGGVFWVALSRWWGRLSDRKGRRPILVIGFAACAVTYLVMAIGVDLALAGRIGAIATLVLLVVTRAVIGGVYAAVPPAAAALIADHTPPPERPARMARLGTANAIGLVAGPAIAAAIAARDLSWVLYAATLLPVLGLAVVTFALPREAAGQSTGPNAGPNTGPNAGRETGPGKGTRPAAAAGARPAGPGPSTVSRLDPRLRLVSLAALVAMSSVAVAQVTIGFFAMDRLGLDHQAGAGAAGLALTTVGLVQILSHQVIMRNPTVSASRWITAGALIAAIGFGGVSLVTTQAQLMAGYGVAAFGMGFIFPSLQAMAANAVDRHEMGAAAGTVSAAQGLGMVVAPLTATLLYGLGPAAPYLLIAAMLAGLGLTLGLSNRRGHRPAATGSDDEGPGRDHDPGPGQPRQGSDQPQPGRHP